MRDDETNTNCDDLDREKDKIRDLDCHILSDTALRLIIFTHLVE